MKRARNAAPIFVEDISAAIAACSQFREVAREQQSRLLLSFGKLSVKCVAWAQASSRPIELFSL